MDRGQSTASAGSRPVSSVYRTWRDVLPVRSGLLLFVTLLCLIYGSVVLAGSLPDDGPVTCGRSVMGPGSFCTVGGPYEDMRKAQRAGSPEGVLTGIGVDAAGVVLLAANLLSARRRPADRSPRRDSGHVRLH